MGEREESMEEVRWERLLPRMPVRVLVVEGDDSTRQIITALLRKCGYRVISVADGLKAWEMLTEKACHVDLVLTEVELPAISGFSLLSMIAEHENYKNIPVIMMSSHDSISMVFKCMLRGAADYLVKPIRKNELRNLWQHVWRRHLSRGEHAGSQCNQDEKPANGDFEANVENNTSSYSSEYVVCMDKNDDSTEKGSDAQSAQSSCTRSDAEAESQCMKNMQEIKHPMGKPLIFMDTEITQNGDEYDMVSLKHAAEAEDKSVTLGPEGNSSEVVAEDNGCSAVAAVNGDLKPINCMHIDNNTTDEVKPKEAIDLIGAIDNHPQYSFAQGDRTAANDLSNVSEDVLEKHINIKPSSVPLLELSLRRTPQTSHGMQENDESKTLNHSNSSAFSLYTNRTPFQASPIPMKFGTEREKLLSPSMKSQVVQVSGNMCEGETLNSVEDTDPSGSGTTNQSLHHSLRTIPFPVPMMWQANGQLLQPMFAPQSRNPYLSAMPTMWKEALHPSSSDQTGSGEHTAMECEQLPTYNSADKQEEITEIRDEQRDVSSAMVDSNNSICTDAPNVPMLDVETGKPEEPFVHDEIRQMDFIRLNQREAALNKYRLKRKDRCYGKKVRYQSRKLLAEQRPRVKGQFVRQVQQYSSDSVTA